LAGIGTLLGKYFK